jgi:hypothetical protein
MRGPCGPAKTIQAALAFGTWLERFVNPWASWDSDLCRSIRRLDSLLYGETGTMTGQTPNKGKKEKRLYCSGKSGAVLAP